MGLLGDETGADMSVQTPGQRSVMDLLCTPVLTHLLLCTGLMNKSFLYYIKLPFNHLYITIYFTGVLNKLKFLWQSGLSF